MLPPALLQQSLTTQPVHWILFEVIEGFKTVSECALHLTTYAEKSGPSLTAVCSCILETNWRWRVALMFQSHAHNTVASAGSCNGSHS